MIKRLMYIVLFATAGFYSIAQNPSAKNSNDTLNYLVGEVNRSALQHGDFGVYFMEEYKAYQPDVETLNKLENEIYNVQITIVLATWCQDSQLQVPRFFKILDLLDYNTNYMNLICVDHDKLAGILDIERLSVEYVPTFIFYRNQKEIGRIIESPEAYLEKDLYKILSE